MNISHTCRNIGVHSTYVSFLWKSLEEIICYISYWRVLSGVRSTSKAEGGSGEDIKNTKTLRSGQQMTSSSFSAMRAKDVPNSQCFF